MHARMHGEINTHINTHAQFAHAPRSTWLGYAEGALARLLQPIHPECPATFRLCVRLCACACTTPEAAHQL